MSPQELESIVGENAALIIINTGVSGTIYVPYKPTATFIDRIGGDDVSAKKLCDYIGGEQIRLPAAIQWRIQRLLERGLTTNEISKIVGRKANYIKAIINGYAKMLR